MKKKILSLMLIMIIALGIVGCGTEKEAAERVESESAMEESVDSSVAEIAEESAEEAVAETEEMTEEELANKLYTVDRTQIENILVQFFCYQVECWAKDSEAAKTIDGMISCGRSMPLTEDIGLTRADSRMNVVADYKERDFSSLEGYASTIYSAHNRTHIKSDTPFLYNVAVEILDANFDEFRYYADTNAVLTCNINVTIGIKANEKDEYNFASGSGKVEFLCDAGNPSNWLICSLTKQTSNNWKLLINEDEPQDMEYHWKDIYIDEFNRSSLNFSEYYLVDINADSIPEICCKYIGKNGNDKYKMKYINSKGEVGITDLGEHCLFYPNFAYTSSIGLNFTSDYTEVAEDFIGYDEESDYYTSVFHGSYRIAGVIDYDTCYDIASAEMGTEFWLNSEKVSKEEYLAAREIFNLQPIDISTCVGGEYEESKFINDITNY